MKFSVIIPVYNRPDEVDELLFSLTEQTYEDFEVIVVEDGSTIPCKEVVDKYADQLNIRYFIKPNSGPAQSRNYGAERATGEFLVIFDSDCILPPAYFEIADEELQASYVDAFGGADKAHESFTNIQKAINYSMTSFFTTGGIRGGRKKMDKFYPRSFNMGIKKEVFDALGGFPKMHLGEDIDLSIRIFKSGYKCRQFDETWVYHKRRTNFKKFFKQVHNFGIARIMLYKKYPESLKFVHILPAVFTLGIAALLIGSIFFPWLLLLILAYMLMVLIDATRKNESLIIGCYSVVAAFIQLLGYGTGFLRAWWLLCVRNQSEAEIFNKNRYK